MPAVVALPVNAPVNVVAETLPAEIFPVTAKLVRVPVDVTFGCAAVVNVPVNKFPLTVPVLAKMLPPVIMLLRLWLQPNASKETMNHC